MKTSITEKAATDGQKKQIRRFTLEDMFGKVQSAVNESLEEFLTGLDFDTAQRVIENGDQISALEPEVVNLIMSRINGASAQNEYSSERVKPAHGYPLGYNLSTVEEQIARLREQFGTKLNPDKAITFFKDVYPKLVLPKWVEGPFVSVRPGLLGGTYGEECQVAWDALTKTRRTYNYVDGQFGPNRLRQSGRLSRLLDRALKVQEGDFIILPGQSGDRFGGYSPRNARASMIGGEAGSGIYLSLNNAIANPSRFQKYEELDEDIVGDERSLDGDGVWSGAFYLEFNGGEVLLNDRRLDYPNDMLGASSRFFPLV